MLRPVTVMAPPAMRSLAVFSKASACAPRCSSTSPVPPVTAICPPSARRPWPAPLARIHTAAGVRASSMAPAGGSGSPLKSNTTPALPLVPTMSMRRPCPAAMPESPRVTPCEAPMVDEADSLRNSSLASSAPRSAPVPSMRTLPPVAMSVPLTATPTGAARDDQSATGSAALHPRVAPRTLTSPLPDAMRLRAPGTPSLNDCPIPTPVPPSPPTPSRAMPPLPLRISAPVISTPVLPEKVELDTTVPPCPRRLMLPPSAQLAAPGAQVEMRPPVTCTPALSKRTLK
jgi:hypothetical protein